MTQAHRDYMTHDIQTTEQCESILKLVKLWQIENILPLVAARLRAIAPLANQVALAYRYKLGSVLLDAVMDIASRDAMLKPDEIHCMGSAEIIAAVVAVREYEKTAWSCLSQGTKKQKARNELENMSLLAI